MLRFELTVADALAYERLPREWSGWQKAALLILVMAVGGTAGFLEEWSGLWWWGSVGALLLGLAGLGLLLSSLCMRHRARRRSAREGRTEVEERDGHLVVRSRIGVMKLTYEEIGNVIVGEHHIFVLYQGGAVILPQRAFSGPEEMRAFGNSIDLRSSQAAP